MIIGAHVPTAGGLTTAVNKGREIGAEALQIFPSAPLQWNIRGWLDADCAEFYSCWPKEFKQVTFHGIYLTNLAAEKSDNLEKTKKALTQTLQLAPKIGVTGTVFHPGSYVNGEIGRTDQIVKAINEVLDNTPKESKLVFENSAGSTMGGKLADLRWLLDAATDKSRVAVCLDTCHAFAAGYDISTQSGYNDYVTEVEELIGLENVYCWHINDSKFGLGEKRDRHENIGEGKIGLKGFELLMNDSRWQNLVGYLEVPGFDDKGPDKRNVDILKELRAL